NSKRLPATISSPVGDRRWGTPRTRCPNGSLANEPIDGVYVSTELFRRLGIVDQVIAKSRMIPAEPVGSVVARGEAEIGFQQISELKPISGIELVGPLPNEVQKITIFSAGIVTGSKEPAAAKSLIT